MSGGQIDTVMQEERLFPPPAGVRREGERLARMKAYEELYERAKADPEKFWGELAREELHWFKPFTQGARVEGAVRQMVRRREDERLVQLPRRAS